MRIGLFTDTYRPAQNGVVVVVDVTRRELEKMGHEVFVFAPSANLRNQVSATDSKDDHLIHFPTIRGAGFKEGQLSVFFPPKLLKKVKDLDIDVLHFFTAGQMALFCCYAAKKTGAVLIGQHCTDTYEYSDSYKLLKLGYAAMGLLMPMAVDMTMKNRLDFATLFTFQKSKESWGKRLVGAMIAHWYNACDYVIAVSEKSANQLKTIAKANHVKLNLKVVPTGVDKPIVASKDSVKQFRQSYNIEPDDEVLIYFGRLGQEKNLSLLIPTIERVIAKRPKAKLIFAGDWEYRATLEKMALESPARNHIIFTGRYDRHDVSVLTSVSKLYLFPSLTDTQGLTVTEAAHGGLPIILCDPKAPACFKNNVNGYIAKNNPRSFANKIIKLLKNKDTYKAFSAASVKLAKDLTEKRQTEKLVAIYEEALKQKAK